MSKNDVLDQFMEALKTWYSWIERDLRKCYTNYEEEQTWNEAIASIKAIPRQNVSRNALVSCLIAGKFLHTVSELLSRALRIVDKWCDKAGLTINPAKLVDCAAGR